MKENTNLKDRDGRDILEGDIVEFFVTYDYYENPTYDSPDATRMVDVVEIAGDDVLFVIPSTQFGSYAWRHNRFCRVIGNIHDEGIKPIDIYELRTRFLTK